MGLGRRKVPVSDPERWVFNKMAGVYDARPPYPATLIDALAAFAASCGPRVCDLGAGIGHLALPLAARGFSLVAVEPAAAMLTRLRERALERGLNVAAVHAAAEQLPLPDDSVDCALIADALHFLDAELLGHELRRTLVSRGGMAVITCELADTLFMNAVVAIMNEAAPRRPRRTTNNLQQVMALADLALRERSVFRDDVPVDGRALERILRSISFIGPAMNERRFADFHARIAALPGEPVWSRSFALTLLRKRD